jgi:hypothetical protein
MAGTRELLAHHAVVYAVDTPKQAPRIAAYVSECTRNPSFAGFRTTEEFARSRLRLGGVYVVNVLHTLPQAQDRVRLLRAARRNIRSSGFVLVDVPSYEHYYNAKMKKENAFGDGYLFSRDGVHFTFYRFTTREELDRWARSAGLARDSIIHDNHHIVHVYRSVS